MNWPELLKDLQRHGWSQTAIAQRCKCAQSTINDLMAGRTNDPRHSIGRAIEALHRETVSATAGAHV
ncbi:helix-turn-helix domain-containing protein [Comamonas testosteroni]|uniref:helix-turn-helix domain-containing protein n=1 Tax=Comamonas testosteroni TaxID=285 RepID=UPI0012D2BE7F